MGKASQYLKIIDKGGYLVEGECFNPDYLQQIELSGWNWGVSDPKVPKPAPKGKEDKSKPKPKSEGEATNTDPKPSTLTITKKTDASTMRLLTAMDRGEVFPIAELVLREEYQGGNVKPFYLEIGLSEIVVVSVSWQATAESAGMTFEETWELNYKYIDFSYEWRGGEGVKTITAGFNRKADDAEGASTKTPPTNATKAAEDAASFKEQFKAEAKRLGLIK